jgi:integrase
MADEFEDVTGIYLNELLTRTRKRIGKGEPPTDAFYYFRMYGKEQIKRHIAKTSVSTWINVLRGFFTANFVALPKLEDFPSGLDSEYETDFVPSQENVKQMVAIRKRLRDKAVIAFLAQTGQRVGVLEAMKRNMITKVEANGLIHGLVEVDPRLANPDGEKVNQSEVRYRFVVGADTMRLLEDLPTYPGAWLFHLRQRQMNRIVEGAAEEVKIQRPIPTEIRGRLWHQVHTQTFRRYFQGQMRKMNYEQREFIMGNKVKGKSRAAGLLTPEKLLEAYVECEAGIAVL